MIKQAAKSKFD